MIGHLKAEFRAINDIELLLFADKSSSNSTSKDFNFPHCVDLACVRVFNGTLQILSFRISLQGNSVPFLLFQHHWKPERTTEWSNFAN